MLFKGIIVLTSCCLPPNLHSAFFYSIRSCSNLFYLFGHAAFNKEDVSLLREGMMYIEGTSEAAEAAEKNHCVSKKILTPYVVKQLF